MSLIGFPEGAIVARITEDKFGTNYGMFQDYHNRGGPSSLRDGFSGNATNGSIEESIWSAPAAGSLKKIIVNVVNNNSAGNFQVRSTINGSNTLLGTILAGQTGVFTFDLDEPFVKNDRIGWILQTLSGSGTVGTITYYEINLVDNGKDQMVGSSGRFFGGQFGSIYMDVPAPQNRGSGPPADARQFEWANRVSRAGVIKDVWWFGTNPAGGNGTIQVEVNGTVEHSELLGIHAGASLDRFDDIDIPFAAGDLLGGSFVKVAVNVEGTLSYRIEFD